MLTRVPSAALLALGLLLAPAAQAQIAEQAVAKIRADYTAAFNAGDAARVARLFADEAIYLPAVGGRFVGRKAIEQQLQSEIKEGAADLKVDSQDTDKIGNGVYDVGSYTMTHPDPAGQTETVSGHYVAILQESEDQPQIKVLIGNIRLPQTKK